MLERLRRRGRGCRTGEGWNRGVVSEVGGSICRGGCGCGLGGSLEEL